jgi:iron complex transport system substrate-binding protein
VRTVAQATERRDRGVELVRDAASRIDRVRLAVRAQPRPRVAALEWLDPVFVAAVVMPCGYDAPRAHEEALAHAGALAGLGATRVVAVNASAYYSRPGPRLVDGLELMAHILHPERVPEAAGEVLEVELPALRS